MKLPPEQTQAVKSWIAAGATVADVQKRLLDSFQLTLTYRDTRFLIDDLGLDIQAPAPKPAAAPAPTSLANPPGPSHPTQSTAPTGDMGDPYDDLPPETGTPAATGSVKLEIDRVVRPGSLVSGSVTFSDGHTGKWALDQYGRLMFESTPPGYRPAAADLQVFQRELSALLQRQGY